MPAICCAALQVHKHPQRSCRQVCDTGVCLPPCSHCVEAGLPMQSGQLAQDARFCARSQAGETWHIMSSHTHRVEQSTLTSSFRQAQDANSLVRRCGAALASPQPPPAAVIAAAFQRACHAGQEVACCSRRSARTATKECSRAAIVLHQQQAPSHSEMAIGMLRPLKVLHAMPAWRWPAAVAAPCGLPPARAPGLLLPCSITIAFSLRNKFRDVRHQMWILQVVLAKKRPPAAGSFRVPGCGRPVSPPQQQRSCRHAGNDGGEGRGATDTNDGQLPPSPFVVAGRWRLEHRGSGAHRVSSLMHDADTLALLRQSYSCGFSGYRLLAAGFASCPEPAHARSVPWQLFVSRIPRRSVGIGGAVDPNNAELPRGCLMCVYTTFEAALGSKLLDAAEAAVQYVPGTGETYCWRCSEVLNQRRYRRLLILKRSATAFDRTYVKVNCRIGELHLRVPK